MYSQNNEEELILQYFKNSVPGFVLDIGANDGRTLSNSLALIERGWYGCMVEPSPRAFAKLVELHKNNPKVICHQVAIANAEETISFWDCDSHLGTGDVSLLATMLPETMAKWRKTKFTEMRVQAVPFSTELFGDYFDLITIDAEGMEWAILQQLSLRALGTRMLVIEPNGREAEITGYCKAQKLNLVAKNSCNLIFCK